MRDEKLEVLWAVSPDIGQRRLQRADPQSQALGCSGRHDLPYFPGKRHRARPRPGPLAALPKDSGAHLIVAADFHQHPVGDREVADNVERLLVIPIGAT